MQQASLGTYFEPRLLQTICPIHLSQGEGSFTKTGQEQFPVVTLVQTSAQLMSTCTCAAGHNKLCEHQALVLTAIVRREELAVFFHARLRHEKLKKAAQDYGLEKEQDLDDYFSLVFSERRLAIYPKMEGMLPVTKESLQEMQKNFLPPVKEEPFSAAGAPVCIVLKKHRYYNYLVVELYAAGRTKEGKIKNPLSLVNPADLTWRSEEADHIKFYSAIAKFQNHREDKRSGSDIPALLAIIKNPFSYDFYYHNEIVSENLSAASLVKIDVQPLETEITLQVDHRYPFYTLDGGLEIKGEQFALQTLDLKFSYFLQIRSTLYLVKQLPVLAMIDLMKQKQEKLLVHASKFGAFKTQVLGPVEDKINVDYRYIQAATAQQIKEKGFDREEEKIIYLSDFGNYVTLTPVIKYGEAEIPVRSKRRIYSVDAAGNEFLIERNEEKELEFVALLSRQHQEFKEQVENDMIYFCLHRKQFLDEDWFLETFAEWGRHGISVLGFNALKENRLNQHKISVDVKVISGINWFNALVDVRFGKKKASLKLLYKAVRNKSRYVQLDDGTLGILPQQWIEKFAEYFNAGDVVDESHLRISKTNFSVIDELYEPGMLDAEVKKEIGIYRDKIETFKTIEDVEVPEALTGILRPYQKHGLNWLNFLDEFNFGGCLADDMGLGKSVQIIAFILSQRKKTRTNTNLLVVPTTLIFNWKEEVRKFAPSVKLLTLHGAERSRGSETFGEYEIILTTYTTLLSDIHFLKDYAFNYIFLDESQNIKNPETQRYKAAMLLQARNKVVITGTPVENNTFDLYSQLSFACPGLLGGKRYFREVYSIPIDKFKVTRRAKELREKIAPFLLRRTKQQVAQELPEKQELVLYCEMKETQQKIYKAYEKEFREYISASTNEELKKSPMNVLKGLTKLRQICDSAALLPDGELRSEERSSKIEMLLEQIEDKSPDHKILVFSQFVSMLELIKKELQEKGIPFAYLTGATKNRGAVVQQFRDDPGVRVFLVSLKAGGTGLNLTEADYVYLVDPWWNPAVENQAIDRSHRIGQVNNVTAVRLICPGTVEEKMMKMQESKRELVSDLIKAERGFIGSLSKEDLLSLFN